MKRILVLLLFIAIIIGSVYAWMLIRPTPQKILQASMRRLVSVNAAQLEGRLQWETMDEAGGYHFGGWASYAGIVDLRDLSNIQASGMAGYNKTTNPEDFRTANIVLSSDRIAFQPVKIAKEDSQWLATLSSAATSTEAWFSVDRHQLLKKKGYGAAIPRGTNQEIRETLKTLDLTQWMVIASSSEQIYGGREYMTIHLKMKKEELGNGILSLVAAWNKRNPTQEEIEWSQSIAKNAAEGDWWVTIDEGSKDIVTLSGIWNTRNAQDKLTGRTSISFVFGVGGPDNSQMAKIPSDSVDLTSVLFQEKSGNLPSASDRSVTSTDRTNIE